MTDQSSSSRGSCQVNDAFPDGDEKDPNSREVRKLLRVMANRRSARESRDRRKKLVADLQEKVANLAEVNAKILESNQAMRRELVDLLQEAGISLPAAALSI
jgi:predicted transcriptional regulator YheO